MPILPCEISDFHNRPKVFRREYKYVGPVEQESRKSLRAHAHLHLRTGATLSCTSARDFLELLLSGQNHTRNLSQASSGFWGRFGRCTRLPISMAFPQFLLDFLSILTDFNPFPAIQSLSISLSHFQSFNDSLSLSFSQFDSVKERSRHRLTNERSRKTRPSSAM